VNADLGMYIHLPSINGEKKQYSHLYSKGSKQISKYQIGRPSRYGIKPSISKLRGNEAANKSSDSSSLNSILKSYSVGPSHKLQIGNKKPIKSVLTTDPDS
jgi:hypothetical protein